MVGTSASAAAISGGLSTASLPGSKPAGAFYFYVADPLVETATDAAEAVEGEMRKLFRLAGHHPV